MCFGVAILGFDLFKILLTSWIWMSISFPKFRKFSIIIALNLISVHFYFSPSGIPIMCILFLLIVSHQSHQLLYSFIFILFSFCSFDWIISNDLSSSQILSSALLVCFWSYQILPSLYFSALGFYSFFFIVFSFVVVVVVVELSFYFYTVFLISFHCLSVCSCSSPDFFRIILMSLLDSYRSPFLWGQLLEFY